MRTIKPIEWTVLIFCCILGFTLRYYSFDHKSLWMDEIYTFNASRDTIKNQIMSYQEDPTYLHPPLFFILNHLFYPFTKPERDLRIVSLIFGTLSIPVFYFLSRLFSPQIAPLCTLSLTFMTYHISLSQEGRSYSMLMFIGMISLYFLMRHLKTGKIKYLLGVAIFYALLFHTSYSSIPFILLSQLLWFYPRSEEYKNNFLSSFLILNSLTFLFCLPWILFIALNYKGQAVMTPFHTENPGTIITILYGIIHDWVPFFPLMIISTLLLFLHPIVSKQKKSAFVLLAIFILPVGGLSLFCGLFKITHFISSKYFINFLPFFFLSLFLSLNAIENKFGKFKKIPRLSFFFVLFFIASNLVLLPFYYRAEKEDLRGLVTYLKKQLQDGDKIFVTSIDEISGILHYFGTFPKGRYHIISSRENNGKKEYETTFFYQNRAFTIHHSRECCTQYIADGGRIWIVARKWLAIKLKEGSPAIFKGYFDGSFLNYSKFPVDASIYLFLWDPKSANEKGIDVPIE